MSFTRQLSEMSASELNEAIDDSNFPQAHILSRGRNNSICSTGSSSDRNLSLMDRNLSQTDESGFGSTSATVISSLSGADGSSSDITTMNIVPSKTMGNRPKLVLKTKGIIPENESVKSPITPRTSTTPGKNLDSFVNKNHFQLKISYAEEADRPTTYIHKYKMLNTVIDKSIHT